MVDSFVKAELLKQLEQLPVAMQHRVLIYARSLVKPLLPGTAGAEFLRHSGMMTPEEGNEFLRGIEEECERIDPNEW